MDLVDYARQFIGVKENPPNSNMQEFGQWYGWNGVPWCAQFVSYVLAHVGVTPSFKSAYCPDIVNWGKSHGYWHNGSSGIQRNDITLWDWGHDGVADHTGFATGSVVSGLIPYVSGNTGPADKSNGGEVLEYNENAGFLLGFVRLPHTSNSAPRPPTGHPYSPQPKPSPRTLMLTSPMMTGPDVKAVQAKIGAAQDGIFGPQTKQKVMAFQQAHHLAVDGIVGPQTHAALGV